MTHISISMVILCVWFTWLYIDQPKAFAPPTDFGVPILLITEELKYLAEQTEALEDRVRQNDELAEIPEICCNGSTAFNIIYIMRSLRCEVSDVYGNLHTSSNGFCIRPGAPLPRKIVVSFLPVIV